MMEIPYYYVVGTKDGKKVYLDRNWEFSPIKNNLFLFPSDNVAKHVTGLKGYQKYKPVVEEYTETEH